MKKFGMVLGAAAIAAIAGCKNPDYKRGNAPAGQGEVKNADTTVVQSTQQPAAPAVKQQCTCAPGTRHTSPCACGGANCYCIVEQKPLPPPVQPVTQKTQVKPVVAPEPETTIYVVQSGDYLAKISKKFNVTIASIKRINGLTNDVVRVGQKLKIPGKFDVAAKPAPVKAAAPVVTKKAPVAAPYTGATKEYVVKSGDTLGAIAYRNGISIRQLKALNGLTNDVVRVGQKLKVPAEKQVKASTKKDEKKADKSVKPEVAKPPANAAVDEKPTDSVTEANPDDGAKVEEPKADDDAKPSEEKSAEAAAAPATTTYVVQEGDDITGISIRFGVSAAEIRELNNLSDTDQLKPGQILKLPAEAQL